MPRMADKARAQEKLGDEDKNFSSETKDLIWDHAKEYAYDK